MELHAATGRGHQPVYFIFWLFSTIILKLVHPFPSKLHHSISDECDWFGSGLKNDERSFGVQPVYLRCREGTVEWQYPRGALRILLRMGQSGKEFKGCLRIDSSSSGANLYLEEPQNLKYLYGMAHKNMIRKDEICFKSVGGQVAIFLEAQGPFNVAKKDVFRLMYDLESIKQRGYTECRPCSNRELLYLFCTSDFVARGFINSLYQNDLTQQTELTIHSPEILRDSEPKVFNSVVRSGNDTYHIGTINRPLHCGTKAGSGEFLFIGRWRLGTPVLSCAPRWTAWKTIKQKALESENLDCLLE